MNSATAIADSPAAAWKDIAAEFSMGLRGRLLSAGDDGYDAARRIWNGMIDRKPRHILCCSGAADVMQAINFARDHGLDLSISGGGHNVSGNAVTDGGLMIDLSPMRGIRVEPAKKVARVEGGCTWRDFDREAQAFGLATTGGVIPSTGVAGLTLGGGLGWLMRKHGLSCDNLLSADVVTADGRLIQASAGEHADLFWALRGGGGNFGVVTSFEFRLHPVGHVLGGMVAYPLGEARAVLTFLRDYWLSTPDNLTIIPAFVTTPDSAKILAVCVCFSGPLADGEKLLRPLRNFGTPVADSIAAMPYVQLQAMLEPGFPPGLRNYWKSSFLTGLGDEAIEILVAGYHKVPSSSSAIAIEQLGGSLSRVAEEATAFSHRRAACNLLILGMWPDAERDAAHIGWVRDLWQAMQPHASGGVYVNYLGQSSDEGAERVQAAYGVNFERLLAVKRRYDTDNVFRLNQNIDPANTES